MSETDYEDMPGRGGRTSVHDLQRVLEEPKTLDHIARQPRQNPLVRHPSLVHLVERARVHELHAVVDARLDEESAVELYDLWGDRAVEDVELHEDAVKLGLVELEVDLLLAMNHVRGAQDEVISGGTFPEGRELRTFMAMTTFVGLWNTF